MIDESHLLFWHPALGLVVLDPHTEDGKYMEYAVLPDVTEDEARNDVWTVINTGCTACQHRYSEILALVTSTSTTCPNCGYTQAIDLEGNGLP
jgi:predicted RNA-binding Zn-ribbon protein involved in translation (DUF1610 family)